MPESWYSLTLIFLYKDRIYASVLIWENTGQRKPLFWSILNSVEMVQWGNGSFTATHAFFFFFFFEKCLSSNCDNKSSTNFYLLKVNGGNTRGICETCSKLTIKRKKRNNRRRSSVFIVSFFKKITHSSRIPNSWL